jgi:hypothetical protein
MANVRHLWLAACPGLAQLCEDVLPAVNCVHAGVSLVTDLAVSEGGTLQGAHALLEGTLRQAQEVLQALEVLLSRDAHSPGRCCSNPMRAC